MLRYFSCINLNIIPTSYSYPNSCVTLIFLSWFVVMYCIPKICSKQCSSDLRTWLLYHRLCFYLWSYHTYFWFIIMSCILRKLCYKRLDLGEIYCFYVVRTFLVIYNLMEKWLRLYLWKKTYLFWLYCFIFTFYDYIVFFFSILLFNG